MKESCVMKEAFLIPDVMRNITMRKSFLILVMLLLAAVGQAVEKYVVISNDAPVWASENRTDRKSWFSRGREIEALEVKGGLLRFKYLGYDAYIDVANCRKVGEPEPVKDVSASRTAGGRTATGLKGQLGEAPEVKQDQVSAPRYATRSVGQGAGKEPPSAVAWILGTFFVAGVITGLWRIFGALSCEKFFDRLAGRPVTEIPWWKYLRPFILLFVVGLVSRFTSSQVVIFAAGAVYEAALVCVRAVKLSSFRAALVEALYRGLALIGLGVNCWLLLIWLWLNSGSTSGTGKCCGKCAYWYHSPDFCTRLDEYREEYDGTNCRYFRKKK